MKKNKFNTMKNKLYYYYTGGRLWSPVVFDV